MSRVNANFRLSLETYADIHRWSISSKELFWSELWDFCGVVGDRGEHTLINGDKMMEARFFPDAKLNFAENLLRRRDDTDALVFWGEEIARARMSWNELHAAVSRMAQALQNFGIEPGDRVVALMPNVPETVVGMLAATSLGAVWSSCSPDFGEGAVLDRFGQIEPKVLIACDGYFYGGKTLDILPKVASITDSLTSLAAVIVVPYMRSATEQHPTVGNVPLAALYDEVLAGFSEKEIEFRRLSFGDPLYILFSSGTTGAPKCIVHSVGGTLVQHLKEHQLHADLHSGDRIFYFTTCTWMMWNWLVSALATDATVLLYDGSPFHPNGRVLFDFAEREGMTHFGTSAKFIDALKKQGIHPVETHDLSSVRWMGSTGSPLVAESFDFVYEYIKDDLYLASIAGGTDIVSCFVCGSPISPIFRGEIACAGLGMSVEVWDEGGRRIDQEKGELVCTQAFPAMPLGFWGDAGDEKYKSAYFEKFPNVWAHGDFAELTGNGGFVIHGRSDATLNPGGVRIGTAEIYRQVEQIYEIVESVVIGQEWNDDVRVILFVVLRDGAKISEEMIRQICTLIRAGASPRHVPAKVIQVSDIPRTRSGKIAELSVRDIVEGRSAKNTGALANPESLDLYRGIPELSS